MMLGFKTLFKQGGEPSKTVSIGTDVAALVLFHPADLGHRADHPIAWYAEPYAYHPEASAGRLMAFTVGADGGYAVRLLRPNGARALTRDEAARELLRFDFRLRVEHGAVFLDNTDGLPGAERMTDPAAHADRWFELPNGLYRARVHVLAMTEASAAADAPTHVIAFHRVEQDEWNGIVVGAGLPDLEPFPRATRDLKLRTGAEFEATMRSHEAALLTPSRQREASREVEAIIVPGEAFALPGQHISVGVPEAWYEIFEEVWRDSWGRDDDFAVVGLTEGSKGAFVSDLRVTQASARREGDCRIGAVGTGLRVLAADCAASRDGALQRCRAVLPAEPARELDAEELSPADVKSLKAAIDRLLSSEQSLARLRVRPSSPSFERESVAAMASPDALTVWLLRHLDLPAKDRARLYRSSPAERLEAVSPHLQDER